jgi:hypothetical protein
MLLEALQKQKKVLGELHPDALTTMNNLAAVLRKQSRWNEAKELEERLLELHTKVLGQHHANTLRSLANLACTYRHFGCAEQSEAYNKLAIECMQKAEGLSVEVYGPKHIKTIRIQYFIDHWMDDCWLLV